MRKTLLLMTVAVLALVLGCGCGPSTLALKSDFWQAKERKIGIAVAKSPVAATHRAGGGLLDQAIAKAASGTLDAHLQSIDSNGFDDISMKFEENLKARGFIVKRIDKPIDLEKLPKFVPTSSGDYHDRDLRMLAADESVDALILLSIDRWGTTRKYYAMIPLESPKPFCVGRGELINLRTNALEWSVEIPEDEVKVEVEGEWDKPPDFINLTTALYKAVRRAKLYLENNFFGSTAGVPALSSVSRTDEGARGRAVEPASMSADEGVWNKSAVSGSLLYGFFSPNDQIRADWSNISFVGTTANIEEGGFGGLGMEGRILFRTPFVDSRLRLGAEYSLQILASEPSGGTIEWSYAGIPVGSTAAENEFLGHSIQALADFKLGNISTTTMYGSVGLGVLFFSGAKDRYTYTPAPPGPYTYTEPEVTDGLPMELAGSARLYGAIPLSRSLTIDPALRVFQSFGNEKVFLTQLSVGVSYMW